MKQKTSINSVFSDLIEYETCIKAILLVGTTLFITLNVGANPTSPEVKKEIKDIFKKNPDKEIVVKIGNEQPSTATAKFETLGGNDTLKDPYDQIREYVDAQDTAYFNQLRKHMETKDSTEQIKCKAVVYAILQDTILTAEQKKILALGQFERLAKMPGSDYRFSKKSSQLTTTDPAYKSRANRYGAYKSYLELLDLKAEIKQLEEQGKQLDEQIKKLYNDIQNLRRQNNLLQQLLDGYQPSK